MTNQKKKINNRTDELFSAKYPKMLSFSLVAEALTGLIYHRPSGEKISLFRYLPESFEQCRLQKTILRHFPYNLNLHSSWNSPIQDGGQKL